MKREKKEKTLIFIREVIVTQTNHWSIFGLAYGLSVMFAEVYASIRLNLILWGVMGLGLLFNYLIRTRVQKFGLGIAFHFLVLLFMAATGLTAETNLILHAAFGFFYCLLSVVKMHGGLEQEDEAFSVPVIAILICAPFFVLTISHYENVMALYRNLLICLFTMFFMQHYFGRYARFVRLNEHSAGFFPKSEIMGAGLKSVIIYVGISAGLFFGIANMDSLTKFGEFITGKLSYYVKLLLKKIFSGTKLEPEKAGRLDYNDFDSLTAKMGTGEVREESLFSIIIQKVIWVLIIALALIAIYRFIKKILALFNMKLDRADVIVDDVVMDVRESCDAVSIKKKKVREKKFFLSPREKVRKSFKRTTREKVYRICKSGDYKQLQFKTSGECSRALDYEELSKLYDRARYSDEEITEQDAARMKKISDEILES